MNRRFLTFSLCLLIMPPSATWAQFVRTQPLASIGELKEVEMRDGGFRVSSNTKIVVEFGHQSEDRIAAETLAEEISDQSGLQVNIVGAKAGVKGAGNAIILARLHNRHVRQYLASKGLKTDDAAIGNEGYVLFSDKSHIIVAANTGQGLFSGVQTLRQLLRSDGDRLICPAVAIRDWPGLTRHGTVDDFSRSLEPSATLPPRS